MLITRTLLALAAVLGGSMTQTALAAPADGVPARVIRIDAAALVAGDPASIHGRIASAARRVCAAEGRMLAEQRIARRCYTAAVRSGELQLAALRQSVRGRQQALAAAAR